MLNPQLASHFFVHLFVQTLQRYVLLNLDSNADGASESFTARWNLQWRIGLVGGASAVRVRYIT
jgi:hypothetical protein